MNPELDSATDDLRHLDEAIAALLRRYEQLRQENRELRISNQRLEDTCKQLTEKNVLARNRVEALISRLHALGRES